MALGGGVRYILLVCSGCRNKRKVCAVKRHSGSLCTQKPPERCKTMDLHGQEDKVCRHIDVTPQFANATARQVKGRHQVYRGWCPKQTVDSGLYMLRVRNLEPRSGTDSWCACTWHREPLNVAVGHLLIVLSNYCTIAQSAKHRPYRLMVLLTTTL